MRRTILTIIFLLLTTLSYAATYYVKNGGNDNASGLSDGNAWATIAKVNASAFSPGDTICFKKGSVWREILRCWYAGSAGNPITYTNYGTGTLPILRGSDLVAVGSWTADGDNWYWQPPTNGVGGTRIEPMQVWENETRLTWKKWTTGNPIDGNGQWAWDATNSRVYIRPTDGTLNDEVIEVGQRSTGIEVSDDFQERAKLNNHDIIIDGIQVEKVAGCGDELENPYKGGTNYWRHCRSIAVGNGYSIIVRNCIVKQFGGGNECSWDAEEDVNWAPGIECYSLSEGIIFNNNTVYDGTTVGIDMESYKVGGTEPYQCYNNSVYDINGIGLMFSSSGGYIHDNYIRNVSKIATDPSFIFGIDVEGIRTPLYIYNNMIEDTTMGIRFYASKDYPTKIYNNIFTGFSLYGIAIAGASEDIEIYHNTIIDLDGYEQSAVFITGACDSITLKNNIVYGYDNYLFYNVNTNTNIISDYNLFYRPSAGSAFRWNNITYTLAQFATYQAASSQDAHSISTNPLLVSASDFHLQAGSPCKDAGATLAGVTDDYEGNARPQGAGYDIGAYEYASTTPDTTAPAAVSNLTVSTGANQGEVNLSWSAPGDDGSAGTATTYIIKYSSSAITTDTQFNAATDVAGEPTPAVAGTNQSMTVTGLTPGQTYYFAMKTQDEVPNTSGLSNSPSAVAKSVAVNNPPVLASIDAKSVNENVLLTFTLSASDADGNSLTYSATNLPSGATFVGQTFSWTPSYTQSGTYPGVHFAVTDGSATDTEDITITVVNVNQAPTLSSIGNKTVAENVALTFTLSASDADSDTLTYSVNTLPSNATLSSSTGAFSWTPSYSQSGTYNLTFSVNDSHGGTASQATTITVTNVNQAPVLGSIGSKTVAKNSTLTFTVTATDADGDTLSYSASNIPSGASFNTTTHIFSWTPADSQAGSYTVTFSVTDTNNASDSEAITITVEDKDIEPPYVEGMNPDSDEVQVPLDTNISFHIKDKVMGVNKNTISLTIQRERDSVPKNIILNGVNQLSQYSNTVVIQGTASDYTVLYDPPNNVKNYQFGYEERVTVRVSADDLAGNKLTNYPYSFTTAMILRGRNLKVGRR
jgi:hypothetical protein